MEKKSFEKMHETNFSLGLNLGWDLKGSYIKI